MEERAKALTPVWRAEEEIGEIADALLLPDGVAERLRSMQIARDSKQERSSADRVSEPRD